MKTIDYKGKSGIYKITNTIDERCYIGSAVSLYNRYHVHKNGLLKGVHHSRHLQNFVKKYGLGALVFSVVEICEPVELVEREQAWIDLLQPAFNTARNAGNTLGITHTQEARLKMSLAGKGQQRSLGRKLSEETKRKIADAHTGKPLHPNFKAASIAANTGRKQTTAEIHKRSLTQSKVTRLDAREIWWASRLGVYQKDIASAYGISQRLVVRVLQGIGIYSEYKQLDKDYFEAQEQRFADHIKQPKLFEVPKAIYAQELLAYA